MFDEDQIDAVRLAVKTLVWDQINKKVNEYLMNTTLDDLAKEYERLNGELPDLYYI